MTNTAGFARGYMDGLGNIFRRSQTKTKVPCWGFCLSFRISSIFALPTMRKIKGLIVSTSVHSFLEAFGPEKTRYVARGHVIDDVYIKIPTRDFCKAARAYILSWV